VFRTIIDIIMSAVLGVFLTLSIVTWMKAGSLEAQITAVQKGLKETNKKVEEAAESAKHDTDSHDTAHAPVAGAASHWGYEGEMNPAKWGEAFPVCGTGKSQSPLDIRGPFEKATATIKLDYKPGPLKLLNNGHTIQVMATPGSTMSVAGESYELLQFHFHRPSEEHVDGKPSAMVAHFVHKSASGKLAVIGVLLNEGKENALIQSVWSHATKSEAPESVVPGVEINPGGLMPAKMNFYSYEGSLTTPPCTEGVTFFILKAAVSLSKAQVEEFPFKMNARPTQPLNGRKITAN